MRNRKREREDDGRREFSFRRVERNYRRPKCGGDASFPGFLIPGVVSFWVSPKMRAFLATLDYSAGGSEQGREQSLIYFLVILH